MSWRGFDPCAVIFFDLDDTLIDFGGSSGRCWELACDELAGDETGYTAGQLRVEIERAGSWYWSDAGRHRVGRSDLLAATREIIGLALSRLGTSSPELTSALAARYRELRDESIALYDGAHDALTTLLAAGYQLGLITNGTAADQRAKLERFGLTAYFDYIGIEGEAGVGKPEAEAYDRALGVIGCDAADAWMIGDNLEWDVVGAQRLGLRTVWIDRHRRGLPVGSQARPDHIAQSVAELVLGRGAMPA